MSHVRKGHLVKPREWAKHLRKIGRRLYWGAHRAAERRLIKKELRRGTR